MTILVPSPPFAAERPPSLPSVGLTSDRAAELLRDHGPNQLAEPEGRSALAVFVDQFRNLLVIVLFGAALLAGLVGDIKDVVVITVVLVLNAALGFIQEYRADKSLATGLRALEAFTVTYQGSADDPRPLWRRRG